MADDISAVYGLIGLGIGAAVGIVVGFWIFQNMPPGTVGRQGADREQDGHREFEFKAVQGLYGDEAGYLSNNETITYTDRRGVPRTIVINRQVH